MARISGCKKQKELSLEDQADHGREVVREIFDGATDFQIIASKGKGERLDRPELDEIEKLIRTATLDFLVMEDIGRLIRGSAAHRLVGIAVDYGTRFLAPNDCIDTAEESWEDDVQSACRDHTANQTHTSKRLKKKLMTRFIEYFGGLVGAPVYNPARALSRRTALNPTVELAREAGFDVLADLAALAETEQGTPLFQAIEERLMALVPVLRARVNASEAITDEDLLGAICEPDMPVAVAPALNTLPEAEQVRVLREKLAPHVSIGCTDADLVAAAQQPNAPLWASGLCQVQTLQRDVAVAPDEALYFSPEQLGRDRVSARLWFEEFRVAIPQPSPLPTPLALAV